MKAILPVAGLGTRLRPLTLRKPKYLIDIAGKPMIKYAIDELLAAGVSDLTFVISPDHGKIRDYIKATGLKSAHFAVQKKAIGNAHAIFVGSEKAGLKEPVVISFGDDVLIRGAEVIRCMIKLSTMTRSPVLLLKRVPRKLVFHYGIVAVKSVHRAAALSLPHGTYQITDIIEKPTQKEAPSNLSIVGRYVLTREIFKEVQRLCSKRKNMSASGEFYLTDALSNHLRNGGRVFGIEFKGTRFDCGSKLGLMKAQMKFALDHSELGKKLRAYK